MKGIKQLMMINDNPILHKPVHVGIVFINVLFKFLKSNL